MTATATTEAIERALTRGVATCVVRDELAAKMASGRPLRIKYGMDPSRPDLHLGHYACFRTLRAFQELGHTVVLIVGDWTAQIGDPSGVSSQRQMLSAAQVRDNAQTYMDQFFKVVDLSRAEVLWQSTWFGTFTLADVIALASKYTVAHMLTREDFAARYKRGEPVSIVEMLYPLMQAYDSVAVRADVELGGTDQTFNLLVGRDIQHAFGQQPQDILTVQLLPGIDGSMKMSKSAGNDIPVTAPPDDMYGKIMRVPDAALGTYRYLLTDTPTDEIAAMEAAIAAGTLNPRDAKARLARRIVTALHSEAAATVAEAGFNRVFREHQAPEHVEDFTLPRRDMTLVDVLVETGIANSRNEARRLIAQGGVSLDGRRIAADAAAGETIINATEPVLLQAGRRHFRRLVPA